MTFWIWSVIYAIFGCLVTALILWAEPDDVPLEHQLGFKDMGITIIIWPLVVLVAIRVMFRRERK